MKKKVCVDTDVLIDYLKGKIKNKYLDSIFKGEIDGYLTSINLFELNIGLTNKNKTFNAAIPEKYDEWKYTKHIIRGIFETDGSLFFSKSKRSKYPAYPRIEIKSASKRLIAQISNALKQKDFNSIFY